MDKSAIRRLLRASFLLFIAAVIFDLSFILYDNALRVFSKPLIMLSLIAYYVIHQSKRDRLFLFALVMALCGDCFLLGESTVLFILGLISFLIMQVAYTIVFYRQGLKYSPISMTIAILVISVSLYKFSELIPSLGTLLIPVIIYTLSILLMSIVAIFNRPRSGYIYLLIGSILFVSSDLSLAYRLFSDTLSGPTYQQLAIYVMFSYALAQACIVKSVVQQPKAL